MTVSPRSYRLLRRRFIEWRTASARPRVAKETKDQPLWCPTLGRAARLNFSNQTQAKIRVNMKVSLLLAIAFLGGCLVAQADVGDGKQAPSPPSQPPSYTYPQPQPPPPAYYYPAPPPAYYYGVPVFIGGFVPPFFGPYFRAPGYFAGYRGFYHRRYFRGYRGGGYYRH
jgi:hypothetical protein